MNRVLKNFLANIHIYLDSPHSKITVGVYFDYLFFIPEQPVRSIRDEATTQGTYLLKDELQLEQSIPIDIFTRNNATGLTLDIQHALTKAFNNNRYVTKNLENVEGYTIVICPIPLVCDIDSPTGAMFFIYEGDNPPKDLEDITSIFSRIVSNWIAKYNDCIYHRITLTE